MLAKSASRWDKISCPRCSASVATWAIHVGRLCRLRSWRPRTDILSGQSGQQASILLISFQKRENILAFSRGGNRVSDTTDTMLQRKLQLRKCQPVRRSAMRWRLRQCSSLQQHQQQRSISTIRTWLHHNTSRRDIFEMSANACRCCTIRNKSCAAARAVVTHTPQSATTDSNR